MRFNLIFIIFFILLLYACQQAPPKKYPGSSGSLDQVAAGIRLPDHVMPVIGCWFWIDKVLQPADYEKHLDMLARHSPYNLLTTSFRIPEREITEEVFYQQIKGAAEYARTKGMGLVVDLDVRLARRAFEAAYPDELQEMLRLKEIEFSGRESVETVIESLDLNDHYTHRTTHYIPLKGAFLRAYAYSQTDEGVIPGTIRDITDECELISASKEALYIRLPSNEKHPSSHACVMVSFTHLAADVFAPHLINFQRELILKFADLPLAGVCKDEWGFPPNFDGNPGKDQFWYSRFRAEAYAERTGGRELLADCFLMHKTVNGKQRERQMVINHFMEMSYLRNSELETDFHHTVKEVFGPLAVSATHPTWWPYPDAREFKKNGLDWWAATRDWAQTDEHTPYPVRTALAKKWGSPIWYNMYYDRNLAEYKKSVWKHALAGGRINYHPIYPDPENIAHRDLALLKGDLMRADCRIRLLNYISRSPINCPVAIVFGHTCAMNWAGPAYDDVGMDLASRLMREGIPVDLIPTSEIWNNSLVVDVNGQISYGPQKYAAVILYHPEFEKASTAEFFNEAANGGTTLFRVGDWTQDFDGEALNGNAELPPEMNAVQEHSSVVSEIQRIMDQQQIPLIPSAVPGKTWSMHEFLEPPTSGHMRLIDGTLIQLAGTENVSGDPIRTVQQIDGRSIVFDAIGMAAARLDGEGNVEAMAAGGLKSFKAPGMEIGLDNRVDLALWINGKGKWEGVIQGWEGDIPGALLAITRKWSRLGLPVPYTE